MFTTKKPTVGQKKPHENKLVFKLVVNKNSIRSIARVAELAPQAVYDKIDFIHRKCLAFAADRERSEEHTSELQSLIRSSYAVFCLKKTRPPPHGRERPMPAPRHRPPSAAEDVKSKRQNPNN